MAMATARTEMDKANDKDSTFSTISSRVSKWSFHRVFVLVFVSVFVFVFVFVLVLVFVFVLVKVKVSFLFRGRTLKTLFGWSTFFARYMFQRLGNKTHTKQ